MRKIRISHIIPSLDVGGAECMLLRLLSHNDNDRFEPSVVSLKEEGELGLQIRDLGFPVRTVGIKSSIPGIWSGYQLLSHVNNLNPDLVVGWMYHGNLAASWVAHGWTRRSLIWNIRHSLKDINLEKPLTRCVIRMGGLLSRCPQKIIYNSQVASLQHEGFGYCKGNRLVIPNGFDLDRFSPSEVERKKVRSALGFRQSDLVIGLVGRAHPIKNYGGFIRSLACFKKQLRDVKIVIAGRGVADEKGELFQAVKQASLTGVVTLLPQTDQPEVLYQGFDLFALPSLSEAFPNVVGEAMACGVPCIVTDVGDAALLVGDTGFVTQADMSEFSSKLMDVLGLGCNILKKLGGKARLRMKDHFQINTIVTQYDSAFVDVF